jgi:HK97 family phage prohead protease
MNEYKTRLNAGETLYRDIRLMAGTVDTEARTVQASLSSDTPLKRWGVTETLRHDAESVDLSRAADGLPMLWQHNAAEPIGIVRDVRLDGGRAVGTLEFSRNSRAADVWQDVSDGYLRNVSIGYQVTRWETNDDETEYTGIAWELLEASVVSVPADQSVGINRAKGDHTVAEQNDGTTVNSDDGTPTVVKFKRAFEDGQTAGMKSGAEKERGRLREIDGIFSMSVIPDSAAFRALRGTAIDEGWSVDVTRQQAMELLGSDASPLASRTTDDAGATPHQRRSATATAGEDSIDKWREVASLCVAVRSGLETDREKVAGLRATEFGGYKLSDLARSYLRSIGQPIPGDQRGVVAAALTRATIGHTTSDFANILIDAANKSAQAGYMEAPETWRAWARVVSVPDFKANYFPQLSTFGDLDVVPEGGEYKYGTFSDFKESMTLKTYGKLFSISRQAIINDDLNSFTQVPRHMGRAAARMVGDEAYGVLTTNGNMNDGNPLFDDTNHANQVDNGSGAVPSVATLNAGFASFGVQTDPAGNVLNLSPSYLIAPKALEGTVRVLLESANDPAATTPDVPNIYRGRLTGVYEARLDANDAAQWYLACNPSMCETVGVALLDGIDAPYLEEEETLTVDGMVYKVRMDCVAGALDWRGLYENDGN